MCCRVQRGVVLSLFPISLPESSINVWQRAEHGTHIPRQFKREKVLWRETVLFVALLVNLKLKTFRLLCKFDVQQPTHSVVYYMHAQRRQHVWFVIFSQVSSKVTARHFVDIRLDLFFLGARIRRVDFFEGMVATHENTFPSNTS